MAAVWLLLAVTSTAITVAFGRSPFISQKSRCPLETNYTHVKRDLGPSYEFGRNHKRWIPWGYPPKIVKSTPSCVRVVEGYSTILTCEADGDPVPVISWMFDDKPVKGSRYIVVNGTVKISPVLSIDDGIYWCHAENRFAITKILIRLKVVLPNEYCGLRVADHHRSKRIIGGVDVNNVRTWPWMVRLDSTDQGRILFCGAVLIHPLWVLSAAHCLGHMLRRPKTLGLRVGLYDIYDDLADCQKIPVRSFHFSYQWFGDRHDHDIVLIRLDQPVTLSETVTPICLPGADDSLPPPGTTLHLTGWGFDINKHVPRVLGHGRMNLTTWQECRERFGSEITDNLMCTYGLHDGCHGDSGSPLMHESNGRWTLQGLVLGGTVCGNGTVYVNLHKFKSWVVETMERNMQFARPFVVKSVTCPTTAPPLTTDPPLTVTTSITTTSITTTTETDVSRGERVATLSVIPTIALVILTTLSNC